MDEHRSRQRETRLIPIEAQHSEGRVHYLLEAEEQILRSIAVRAPVPQILNEISTALDCQIGNMVSLISLPKDEVASTAEIARNAALFGLHLFFSGSVLGECGKELGSLEMYCCTMRNPSCYELQVIERAVCLAAITIERDGKEDRPVSHRKSEKRLAQENAPGWPISIN
jgi:hypothetical protein